MAFYFKFKTRHVRGYFQVYVLKFIILLDIIDVLNKKLLITD